MAHIQRKQQIKKERVNMNVTEVSVAQAATKLGQAGCLILDVREPWELELASVAGTVNIPMNQVPDKLSELDKDAEIYVMCHHGGRSMQVAQFLARHGFSQVFNVTGGIHIWSSEVDTSIVTY